MKTIFDIIPQFYVLDSSAIINNSAKGIFVSVDKLDLILGIEMAAEDSGSLRPISNTGNTMRR